MTDADGAGAGEEPALAVVRDGRVARLTLDRPLRRNALNRALQDELAEAFSALGDDDGISVIVLTGAGSDAFCAGVDLKEHAARDAAGVAFERPMAGVRRNLFELVLETPKPTIAVLNGPAVGGGCELALACDLRLAAPHAYLQLPEARRGMGANFASVLLPRLIPRAIALELLYAATPITPERAYEVGLLNRVVAADALAETAAELARSIAANAPLTVRRYKHVALKGWELPVPTALRLDVGPDPYRSDDRVEGIRAFVEKRDPRWTAS
ncbi:MAG: enoyl-CoA hydratase [Conexibacter sp.]|nr:enoyl-CoA hydratase [Conexibacter sp.]